MRTIGTQGILAGWLALVVAGCGGEASGPGGTGARPETVDIDGSSTVFRISQAAREAYSAGHPDVTVVVDNHGTGGGFSNYLNGEIDIVDASRPAKPDEESKAKAQGLEWTQFIVGYDGITVVVNPKNNFVKSLSVAQLKAIWAPDSKVKTWKDVDPAWPARPITLYCPDRDSGTFEYFTEAVTKRGEQRDDVQPSADDNTLVNGVAGDPDGLGYFGYAYFEENKDKLRAVPIQKGADDAPVMPSNATILDKTYAPLSRPLFIYVKNAAMRRPGAMGFVKFYLENIEDLAKKGGYVPPTQEDRAGNQKSLPAAAAPVVAAEKGES